uniref:NADH dehydrogenase [ubiquinone] 1 alpha subcomplex subunit 1 n=1 Tax=Ornithodoros moubata TaxID=6938 RepID=Q6QVL6_ORNMO|nr:NADH-ubiquinone oxidoreductase [Ornithodoros moubata]
MWYEILPSAAVIAVCMSIPNFISPYINRLWEGKPYRRCIVDDWHIDMLKRDERISGIDGYQTVGLDNLPDEPPKN